MQVGDSGTTPPEMAADSVRHLIDACARDGSDGHILLEINPQSHFAAIERRLLDNRYRTGIVLREVGCLIGGIAEKPSLEDCPCARGESVESGNKGFEHT